MGWPKSLTLNQVNIPKVLAATKTEGSDCAGFPFIFHSIESFSVLGVSLWSFAYQAIQSAPSFLLFYTMNGQDLGHTTPHYPSTLLCLTVHPPHRVRLESAHLTYPCLFPATSSRPLSSPTNPPKGLSVGVEWIHELQQPAVLQELLTILHSTRGMPNPTPETAPTQVTCTSASQDKKGVVTCQF
jgi:hypothetical protein